MPPDQQKAAADLLLQLDAMRRARQVDQETCQRLASRVAELEDEILRLRALLAGDVVGARTGLRLRPRIAEGTSDERSPRCAECKVPTPMTDAHGMCEPCGLKRWCNCEPPRPHSYVAVDEKKRCIRCGDLR